MGPGAAAASGVEIVDARSLSLAGRHLLAHWASESVLISRGESGIALFRRDGPTRHFPAAAREVFDVTGAGDTVISVMASAMAAGGTPLDAMGIANYGGGLICEKVGIQPVTPAELRAAVLRHADADDRGS